jgi:hypothetical protein
MLGHRHEADDRGNMPAAMVRTELQSGRLVRLDRRAAAHSRCISRRVPRRVLRGDG